MLKLKIIIIITKLHVKYLSKFSKHFQYLIHINPYLYSYNKIIFINFVKNIQFS